MRVGGASEARVAAQTLTTRVRHLRAVLSVERGAVGSQVTQCVACAVGVTCGAARVVAQAFATRKRSARAVGAVETDAVGSTDRCALAVRVTRSAGVAKQTATTRVWRQRTVLPIGRSAVGSQVTQCCASGVRVP